MRSIYIMSGLPASGKSTYADNYAQQDDIVLHRDDFRAKLRAAYHTEEYFPLPADEEYKLWINHIKAALRVNPDKNVWIDQTTVTQGALNKVLNALKPALTKNDSVTVIVLHCALHICLQRNAKRTGHACVPDHVIKSMYESAAKNPINEYSTYVAFPGLQFTIDHTTETEGI